MFSTNLKRSVAILGVVAGFLVAAGPASAMNGQEGDDTLAVKAPKPLAGIQSEVEPVELRAAPQRDRGQGNPAGTQVSAWHQTVVEGEISSLSIATAEVFELNLMGGNDTLDARTNPSFAVDMGSSEN